MMDGLGREEFYRLLDEVKAEHLEGAKLDIRNNFREARIPEPQPVTAEQIILKPRRMKG